MKKRCFLFALTLGFTSFLNAQDRLVADYQPIKNELVAWDQIRGTWLANSLDSMMRGKQIPDRTFPENFTPIEMYKVVPQRHREYISDYAMKQRVSSGREQVNAREWERLNQIVQIPNCRPTSGRSYGDPHLVSFDGESYSFQTVGEFVLAASTTSDFMIQTRQKAVGDNFSLNMAVAMNVAGDRIGIYVEDNPAECMGSFNRQNSPLFINGEAVEIENGSVFFLTYGGTISRSGNDYTISWPTGEKLVANVHSSGAGSRNGFINCTVEVYSCTNSYYGLLGNANGRGADDFDVRGMKTPPMLAFSTFGNQSLSRGSNVAEKQYLAFLAKDFARQFRITQDASLFDYCGARNTLSFTDERFPMVHMTVDDLTPNQQTAARQNCRDRGVGEDEMRGCIFDQAFISLPPSPRPVIKDPTVDYKPKPLEREVLNVNNRPQPIPKKPMEGVNVDSPRPSIRPDLLEEKEPGKVKPIRIAEPVPAKPSKEVEAVPSTKPSTIGDEMKDPSTKPVFTPNSKPEKPSTKPSIIGDEMKEPSTKPVFIPNSKPEKPSTPSSVKPKAPMVNPGAGTAKPKVPIGTGGSMLKGGK